MACFGFGKSKSKDTPIFPFTSFVLKVDATGSWESTAAKVLKKTKEVSNFEMLDDGMLQVSGTLNPVLLLKVLAKSGKAAELVGWKFGGCSRNLHMPEFKQYQHHKRYLEYYADLQAYYNTLHRHGGYNYGDGYGRSYENSQYLPPGYHHPTYGYPRH